MFVCRWFAEITLSYCRNVSDSYLHLHFSSRYNLMFDYFVWFEIHSMTFHSIFSVLFTLYLLCTFIWYYLYISIIFNFYCMVPMAHFCLLFLQFWRICFIILRKLDICTGSIIYIIECKLLQNRVLFILDSWLLN